MFSISGMVHLRSKALLKTILKIWPLVSVNLADNTIPFVR